jgi:hypothetical protein
LLPSGDKIRNKMSAEEHLPEFSVRPRFQVESPMSAAEVVQRIKDGLKACKKDCQGTTAVRYAIITVPERERHFWSPHLTITIEDHEGGGCLVRGLYSPAPMAWTMFVFFYTVIGMSMLGALLYGLSCYSLDKPTTAFWWALGLAMVLLSIYLVSYSGQKLGRKQLGQLHRFIEDCLGQTTT